jgi:hypothetical protein
MRYCIKWTLFKTFLNSQAAPGQWPNGRLEAPARAALARDHDAKISHFHVLSASKHVQPGLK